MEIALVQCPLWDVEKPPLGLAYISAILKKNNHSVFPFDLNAELFSRHIGEEYRNYFDFELWKNKDRFRKIPIPEGFWEKAAQRILDTDPGIIGFCVQDSSFLASMLLATKIRKMDPSRTIIFGGPDCYLSKTEVILSSGSVDYVVRGEGEETIVELIDSLENSKDVSTVCGISYKNSKVMHNKDRSLIKNLDSIPFPDFSGLPLELYKAGSLPFMISRGCVNRCVFCDNWMFWKYYRFRSARNVVDELKHQIKKHKNHFKGTHVFVSNDLLINGNPKELYMMCDLIIKEKLDIRWSGFAAVRNDMTEELLKIMKQAGCIYLNFGIESGSNKVLRDMGKKFRREDAERLIRITHKAGIGVVTNWIVGYPTETKEDFQQTIDFLVRNKEYIDFAAPASPLIILGDVQENFIKYGIFPGKESRMHRFFNRNKPLHSHWQIKGNNHKIRQRRKLVLDTIAYKNDLMTYSSAIQNRVRVNKEGYCADIKLLNIPSGLSEGDEFEIEVNVKNKGKTPWKKVKTKNLNDITAKGLIALGISLLSKDRIPLENDLGRGFLSKQIWPGESATVKARLRAPEKGSYYLKLDMVREYIGRFSEIGSEPLWVPIIVEEVS
ncbi:radical SAM protein [Candidatus Woesearchaeota archaeon]|nr:radical SAM protein [Candidatus Woesearchaeota archaeon]